MTLKDDLLAHECGIIGSLEGCVPPPPEEEEEKMYFDLKQESCNLVKSCRCKFLEMVMRKTKHNTAKQTNKKTNKQTNKQFYRPDQPQILHFGEIFVKII